MRVKTFEEIWGEDRSLGYHVKGIPKGILGEPSKVLEECLEFIDACEQGVDVLALCELADIYGAIEFYLAKHHPTITMYGLAQMAKLTRKAFANGTR